MHTFNMPDATVTPPWLFRCLKTLKRHHVRGANRVLLAWQYLRPGSVATYPLAPGISFAVPIGRTAWDVKDMRAYETELIAACCSALAPLSRVTLFDCGADIGLFTALLCSRCDRIARLLAFEPNVSVEPVLRYNLSQLPSPEVYMAAVSNFEGFGTLLSPDYDPSDHGRFLVRASQGVPVLTLDSFQQFGGDILIKLDVEGGELHALEGARETIRRAAHCVLTLEAHPLVCQRTGITPNTCMALASSIRPFHFVVAETGRSVEVGDDILDPVRVLNLVATSDARAESSSANLA